MGSGLFTQAHPLLQAWLQFSIHLGKDLGPGLRLLQGWRQLANGRLGLAQAGILPFSTTYQGLP